LLAKVELAPVLAESWLYISPLSLALFCSFEIMVLEFIMASVLVNENFNVPF